MSDGTDSVSTCAHHATAPAMWWCPGCQANLCNACVREYQSSASGVALALCIKCERACGSIEKGRKDEVDDRPFGARLPGVVAYPFLGNGWILLLVGAACFWVLGLVAALSVFGHILQFMIAGYLASYMIKILASSANNDPELPPWPDLTDFWDDLLRPILLLIALVAVCFLPAFVWAARFTWGDGPFWVLTVLGLLYLPMGMIAIALWDNVAALNPMIIVPAILRLPFNYLLACLGIFIVVAVQYAIETLGEGRDLGLGFHIIASFVAQAVSLYVLAVEMRILGLLYHTNRHRLGWFE